MTGKIEFIKPRDGKEIELIMHPLVREWFFSKFKSFSLTQLYGVMPIHERKNILVSAPTGGTKTLTAFLSILNYLVGLAEKNELEEKVYAVYNSPLKALSNDVYKNLIEPLEEIEKLAEKKGIKLQKIRVSLRTGDTTTAERSKMLKNCPHILVSTPETLAILLTTSKFVEKLRGVEFMIVDEIHALANKRGVYLSLSLERLQEISKIEPVRIGLSATIAPLEEIAKFLVGTNGDCGIAEVEMEKKIDIEVVAPSKMIETSADDMHDNLYEEIDRLIQEHKTTLIFTNTRAATERVIHHLKDMFPAKYLENIGAHHSSLSKEHRFGIEERLRKGELKVVVTSTSLELGIDIGYVDLVILLGSPKSTARALQRCLTYENNILCSDGVYRKIGEIVENKLDAEVISYDKERGFISSKIRKWHKNSAEETIVIKLKCGEEINCTEEHPILTDTGWRNAGELLPGNLVAEIRSRINFKNKEPYLFELIPKNKIFVANKDNFFQKIIDKLREERKINADKFAKEFGMPYSRFIDCRRIIGRKKSIRLDYFLNACEICRIPIEEYLPYLHFLKTKGARWPEFPLKLTKEIMWLAGIVATDGCIVKSQKKGEAEYYKIKIGNKSKVMIDKIAEIVKRFQINPYLAFKEGFYNLEFGSNLFAYVFMSLGIPCKNKSFDIEISEYVFSLPPELAHSYLEGIFEGDGNLNLCRNHGMMRIFSASEKFIKGMHLLFSRLGYSNKISKRKIKSSKLIKKTSGKDLYCVSLLRKEDLRRFFENIEGYGEKARRGKESTKDYSPYLSLKKEYNTHIDFCEVESVEKAGKREVYNLTLDKEPNNFVVGNVIVHNCGRAGHKLHDIAKGRFLVLDRDDLVECSVILKESKERKIDRVFIPKNCLDVLSQQIFGMAIYKIWDEEEMFNLIRRSYCYSTLTRDDFLAVISYLAGDYALEHRQVYAKIWYDEKTKQIGKRGKLARVMYMTNIGTIPDESFISVVIAGTETTVGKIDEGFLERLKPRDVFVLGGAKYEFAYTRGMKAYVRGSVSRAPTIPSWFSEMLPLSFDLAMEISRFRGLLGEKFSKKLEEKEIKEWIRSYLYVSESVAEEIYDYCYSQFKYIGMPSDKKIIIERYSGEKEYVIFHSLFGRRVNDALSRAIAFLAGRLHARDVEIGISDNGFFLCGEKLQIERVIKHLTSKNVEEILKEAIEKTEVLKRRFRHCAARSLMILRNYKGRTRSAGKQQMKSHFLYSAVKRLSNEFPILQEARREVMEDLMDIENTKVILELIESGRIKLEYKDTDLPSPFSLGLIMQGYSDLVKMEDRVEFLKRMHLKVLERIGEKNK